MIVAVLVILKDELTGQIVLVSMFVLLVAVLLFVLVSSRDASIRRLGFFFVRLFLWALRIKIIMMAMIYVVADDLVVADGHGQGQFHRERLTVSDSFVL